MPIARAPARRSTSNQHHVVVVGAGITGLLAAMQAVTDGHRVTLIDRGSVPDAASTSFDRHRVIRALDPGDVRRSRRDAGLQAHWADLEARLCGQGSTGLLRRTGVVTAWRSRDAARATTCAKRAGIVVKEARAHDFTELVLPRDARVLHETDAGVILADRALIAAAEWLAARPEVTVLSRSAVAAVDALSGEVAGPDGPLVRGDLTVVACGPWSASLVGVPAQLHRQTMAYLRPPTRLSAWWRRAPVVARVGPDAKAWAVPAIGGSSIKLSTDDARRIVSSVGWEGDVDESVWCQRVLDSQAIRDIGSYEVTSVRRCHYATSEHSDSLGLVRVGPRVWARIASGSDGFRTAPLAAEQVLRELRPATPPRTSRTGRKAT